MKRALAAVVALGGCGRIDFDLLNHSTGDGGASDAFDALSFDVSPALPPGLGLWLPMDTDVTLDVAGHHTVTCAGGISGCPSIDASGKHGGAADFAGIGAARSLTVAYAADLDPTAGFTIAAWAKLVPSAGFACAFAEPYAGDPANFDLDTYAMCVDGSGTGCPVDTPFWNADLPTMSGNQLCSIAPIDDGAWHHLAMTWDGATKRGWVDGTAIVGGSFPSLAFDAQDLLIGGDTDASQQANYFWSGELDDVMWFDRALAATEIAQLAAM